MELDLCKTRLIWCCCDCTFRVLATPADSFLSLCPVLFLASWFSRELLHSKTCFIGSLNVKPIFLCYTLKAICVIVYKVWLRLPRGTFPWLSTELVVFTDFFFHFFNWVFFSRLQGSFPLWGIIFNPAFFIRRWLEQKERLFCLLMLSRELPRIKYCTQHSGLRRVLLHVFI